MNMHPAMAWLMLSSNDGKLSKEEKENLLKALNDFPERGDN